MRRASPERGENSGPARNFIRSLTPNPELENPGSVASCGNRLTEGIIGKQTQSLARLPSSEPGRSKTCQPPVVMTRYPNKRTWLATAKLRRSRIGRGRLKYNCACSPTSLSREANICRASLSTRGFVKSMAAERGRWVNKSTGQRLYGRDHQSRPYVNARPRHGRHPISVARPIDQAVDVLGCLSTSRHLPR
jgi:hypothetical protein